MQQDADEEEGEQEILALPAPGDALSQEGQLEAEMHAAIASAELADYAQVGCPPSPAPSPLRCEACQFQMHTDMLLA